MCLQYTDFSRTVIGSFVPVLSDGSLKREVSLSLQTSIQSCSSPLCCARPTEWEAADRQTDSSRQVEMGWSTLESFLLITIWHTGRGRQSAQQPILTFLLQQRFITANFICTWCLDTQGAEDMERDYPKYTAWMRLDTSCSQCSIHMLKMYLFVYNRHIFLLDCQYNFEKKKE